MTIQRRATNLLVCGVTVFASRLGSPARGKRPPLRKGRVCGADAEWAHPRWPQTGYCSAHKKTLETFFPDGWELLSETPMQRS